MEPSLVELAVSVGVKHVVIISHIGANMGEEAGTIIQAHGEKEYEIIRQRSPVTFLR